MHNNSRKSRSWENRINPTDEQQRMCKKLMIRSLNEYNHFSSWKTSFLVCRVVGTSFDASMMWPRCEKHKTSSEEIEWKLFLSILLIFSSACPAINYTFDIDEFLCGRNWMSLLVIVVCECNYANISLSERPQSADDRWWILWFHKFTIKTLNKK